MNVHVPQAGEKPGQAPDLENAFARSLVARYAAPLPRYTSYPTANHFTPAIGSAQYRAWLAALPPDVALSLYLHIPFCESLCWYCACSTKATRRYEPVARYLKTLMSEIDTIASLVPPGHRTTHLHWGGGSPDILSSQHIRELGLLLRRKFRIDPEAEFAIEIDPRLMTADKAESLVEIGINRLSIGVQDFDPLVQQAIGRLQGYDVSKGAIDLFRQRGVQSVNIDLVYGLPHQSPETLGRTIEQVIELNPDRIAMFGYAHLPARVANQRLIDETSLPGPMLRWTMARQVTRQLLDAGYVQLGIDHFARRNDSLATQSVNRNFQGYTTDTSDALIGFGASAIGRLPQGYVQNAVAVGDYASRVETSGLATARGWELTADDAIRAFIIERLMCDFEISRDALVTRFGKIPTDIMGDIDAVRADDKDGLLDLSADGLVLTATGRLFVRNICARFDAHLSAGYGGARHSMSV